MKDKVALESYLIYNEQTGTYSMDPEQAVRDEVEKKYWFNVLKAILKDWRLYLMLVPMIFVFVAWRYLPMYELLAAFKHPNTFVDVSQQDFSGFAFFKTLLVGARADEFWPAFRNTFLLSFYGLLFGFPIPIIIALFFNEVRSNAVRSIYQVLLYLPRFLSTVVITSLVILLLQGGSPDKSVAPGIISQFLTSLGLVTEKQAQDGLMLNPDYFRAIYQISGIWEDAGYGSIVFFAAIIAISPTSYEAAQIDGAGKMQQMRYVVLPSILSTIVIMLIMRIGNLLAIGSEKVLLLYRIDTYSTADVISTFAHRMGVAGEGTGETKRGIATAAEMLNNLIGMILVIGANMIARKASDVSLY